LTLTVGKIYTLILCIWKVNALALVVWMPNAVAHLVRTVTVYPDADRSEVETTL
jgi:hypothetical protein